MHIQKFEQSGLLLTSSSGFKLAIDIAVATPIESLVDITADAMLVSHIHGDHCSAEHIATLKPATVFTGAECISALGADLEKTDLKELKDGDTVTIGDFTVTAFEVDHGPNAPKVPAQNFGFLITEGNETLYFAGDMFNASGIDVTDLEVIYACVPVGGHYTFDHQSAFEFACTFKSIETVIPLHYENFPQINTNGAEDFKNLASEKFTVEIL